MQTKGLSPLAEQMVRRHRRCTVAEGRRKLNWSELDGKDALNMVLVVFGIIAILAGTSNWLAVGALALPASAVILAKLFGRSPGRNRGVEDVGDSDSELREESE